MSFNRYISHPSKGDEDDGEPTLLIGNKGQFDADGHLRTVADRMMDACRGQELADDTSTEPVAEVVGLTHDFAKLTSWAQKHLRGQPFQQPDAYRYHAFPSALVTLYCLTQYRDDISDYAAEVATVVVTGHHNTTSPPEPAQLAEQYGRLTNDIEAKYERIQEQIDDINATVADRADCIIRAATNGEGSWEEFREWHIRRSDPIDGAHDHLMYFAKMANKTPRNGYYTDVIQLWTALKFADQTAASELKNEDLNGSLPDRDALDSHVAGLSKGEGVVADLNDLRSKARSDVTENVKALVDSDEVGLITLPTGFGKTYAGLSAGLCAADMNDSRMVYVLPYTSILDQIAKEIQNIFDVSPYSDAFTLHHHLSNTYTELGDHYTDADIGRSPGALHAESWLSGISLTTTVQLFESLTAPTARQATRIPSLHKAVVVLDEPQTIPENWWQIVPVLIELLIDTYDVTVILMTATQPGLVEYGSDEINTRELTEDTDQYINFLDTNPRVTYRLHHTIRPGSQGKSETLDYPAAGREVLEAANGGSDVLAICNTRASAKDLYHHVTQTRENEEETSVELGRLLHKYAVRTGELPSPVKLRQIALETVSKTDADRVYAFLSGDVRPDDRSLIIDALYDDEVGGVDDPESLLDWEGSIILIATSVVEAGVDISFDTVFRDYAPIPNIVQSGGRCNRSFESETGEMIIWRLAEPEDGASIPSLVIHGGNGGETLPLLQKTGQVLQRQAVDHRIAESTMISKVVAEFYESLFEGGLSPGDEHLAAAVNSASMSKLEGEHMINEIEDYEDVVVCLTEEERDELLTGNIKMRDISNHPGSQVNTDPAEWEYEVSVGESRYLLLDGHDASYDPVFGVQ